MTEQRKKLLLAVLVAVWAVVAVSVWVSMRVPSVATAGDPTAAASRDPAAVASRDERTAPVPVPMQLQIALLDRNVAIPEPARDLFSMAPISASETPAGTGETTTLTVAEPVVGAQLRYMGYVEMGGGTIALLQEGSEMYLARQGERVGPGYLITAVEEAFVEIEYRGARRRLPVYAPPNGTNGEQS